MAVLDDDPRWDTFGLLLEAYRAVDAAIERDTYESIEYDRQVVDLMIRLARSPDGRLHPAEIATALATTRPHATVLIDRAEASGLVRRDPDPDDRRSSYVSLTTKGTNAARSMACALLDAVQAHVHDQLRASEVAQLEDLLHRLRDAAQDHLTQASD